MEGAKTVEVKAMETLEEIRKLTRGVRKTESNEELLDLIEDLLFDYDRFVAMTVSSK